MSERKVLRSNADWILIKETDGSIIAKSQTTGEERKLQKAEIDSMKSLLALIEAEGVKIE